MIEKLREFNYSDNRYMNLVLSINRDTIDSYRIDGVDCKCNIKLCKDVAKLDAADSISIINNTIEDVPAIWDLSDVCVRSYLYLSRAHDVVKNSIEHNIVRAYRKLYMTADCKCAATNGELINYNTVSIDLFKGMYTTYAEFRLFIKCNSKII